MEWFVLGYFLIGLIFFFIDTFWIEREEIVDALYRQGENEAREIVLRMLSLSAMWPLTIMILCVMFVRDNLIDDIEDAIIYILTRPIDLIIRLATKIEGNK